MTKRLKDHYKNVVTPAMQERFSYSNVMLVPKLVKIVISMGIGEATKDKNAIQDCIKELTLLSGQKPIVTKTKIAIANFKTRKGQAIGLKVTLREKRMLDFFDRFCHIVAPRIRDFRGFSNKCDGQGNYSMGLQEQQIFPEIPIDEIKRTQGMNVTFVTSALSDDECRELLRLMGFPFQIKRQGRIMSMHDPISDFLTRIRNATLARFRFVDLPFSKLHVAIAGVLREKGFVENFLVDEPGRRMRLFLRYDKRRLPVLRNVRRVSTPGLRNYITHHKIPRIYGGLGIAVLSTSKGVMDGEKARAQKLGGELLCVAW